MYPQSFESMLVTLAVLAFLLLWNFFFGKVLPIIPGAMAALTADRITERKELGLKSFPVKDATKIFGGALTAVQNDGHAVPASDTANLKVVGVSSAQVDNSSGADGDLNVNVYRPIIAKFAASSITQAMVGKVMYVVDDQTFDDAPGTNAIVAGVLVEFVSTTEGWLLVGADGIPNAVQGVAVGYKLARGEHTTVAASDDVATGLSKVIAVTATLASDPVAGMQHVTATVGDQAGTPAAGSVTIKGWKATATGDTALIAATTFAKKVNWVAIGT